MAAARCSGLAATARCAQWPVGGSSICGLQLVGHARQLVQGEPERSRDPVGDVPGRIGYPALETPDRGRIDVGDVGYSLLAEPDLFTAKTDRSPKSDLRAMAYTHS